MTKLLAFFFPIVARPHDDLLRANQFSRSAAFSPYIAMLPYGVNYDARG